MLGETGSMFFGFFALDIWLQEDSSPSLWLAQSFFTEISYFRIPISLPGL